MPTSIPYDPSLELANIVPQNTLNTLLNIAQAQAPVDAAQDALNRAIMTVRSLDMTMSEMVNMGIDASKVTKSLTQAKENVQSSAQNLIDAKLKAWPEINKLRGELSGLHESLESPVDYNRTEIKQMPLSADSLNFDAQYFSHDGEQQGSSSSLAAISSYVSAATSFLGDKFSSQATASAQQQVSQQMEHHDVEGTLIITAGCTHRMAAILAPFVIDVDKGVRVFNRLFPDNMIKTNSVASMAKIAQAQDTKNEKSFSILSGANYGSSFIGMVHVLRTEDTQASQKMKSVAASLQAQMEVSCWFESEKGGFGADSSFANDAKRLLSEQNISSHISLISMGGIPSVVSNEVQLGVQKFADFDPAAMMGKLAAFQNATNASDSSVAQAADKARTGQTMMAINHQQITSVMSGLQAVDDGSNKMLDINSLMTAFEDYIQKAIDGKVGVPINYFIKPITASQLAQMWIAKYYPAQYVTAAGDDTKPAEPASPSSGNGAATGDDATAH